MKRITLSDVAKRAKVTVNTVSCALRGTGRMNEETRNRIRQIADEMGYRANKLANAIKSGRSHTIGLVLPSYYEFSNRILSGVYKELHNTDYHLLPVFGPAEVFEQQLQDLVCGRVDGVLMWPLNTETCLETLGLLQKNHIPIVAINEDIPQIPCGFVGSDDFYGGQQAAKILLESGHKKIAYVGVEIDSTSQERSRGFERCLAATSQARAIIRNVPNYSDYHGDIKDLARELLSGNDRPDAIFTFNDVVAALVYQVAGELGIKIPEKLALIGYGNLEISELLSPPLSSLDQFAEQMGGTACKMLIEHLTTGKEFQKLKIKPAPVLRDSTR